MGEETIYEAQILPDVECLRLCDSLPDSCFIVQQHNQFQLVSYLLKGTFIEFWYHIKEHPLLLFNQSSDHILSYQIPKSQHIT